MNKKVIAMAVGAALMTPLLAQAEGPIVYGQLHLSYGAIDEKTGATVNNDNIQLRSHDSRIGFKGERDFGNGLMGTYKIELGVDPDSDLIGTTAGNDGTAGIVRRNMYVGLKGGWGEVRIGRHDTPLKMAQGKFDQFGDTDGDLKHAGDEDGENRLDNILMYMGKSGDFSYNVAVAPGEDAGAGSAVDDGPADTISAAIAYKSGPLYIALAQDSYENGGNLANDSLTRLVGTYKMGNSQIGVLYQTGVEAADNTAAEEDWIGVSFGHKFGKNKLKAQYIMVEDSATPSKKEGTLMAIGIDHKFDKKTTGYIQYTNLEEEQAGATTYEKSFIGVGMKLKF